MWQTGACVGLLMALLVCAVPGLGQEKTLLVKEHPRLFFTSADMERIKAAEYAQENLLTLSEFTIGYFGGKKVTFAFPPPMPGKIAEPPGFDAKSYGHYPYWTGLSGNIESHLKALALSYASTGRDEFARRAADYCLTLVGWEVWTDPDYHPNLRPCLDTGHITLGVAIAYDICHGAWSEDERQRVRAGLLKLGLESLYAETLIEANQNSDANWDILYNGALGVGALALVGEIDDDIAWPMIEQATSYFLRLLDAKMTSPNTEGLAYSSSLDHGVRFADVLKRVTGDERFFQHPYVCDYIPRWIAYFLAPDGGGCVNFCDAGGYPKPFTTLLTLAANNGDGLSGWLLRKMGIVEGKDFQGIIYGNGSRPVSAPPDDWPTSGLMENIGWAALRSGWDDDDTLLAFKCSSSKHGHDHRDAGNFIINHAGTWLATDLGYGSFRNKAEGVYSRGTAGHNCILVDEQVQKTKDGMIEHFYGSDALDYVVGEATACYEADLVEKVKRHIIFVKPDYYLVYDELAAGEPRQYQWLLHADKQARWLWDGQEPEVGDERAVRELTIVKPKAELRTHFLAPTQLRASYATWPGTEANYQPYMTVTTPEKAAELSYVVALAPKQVSGSEIANCGFEWGTDGWAVAHDGESKVEVSIDTEVKRSGRQAVKLVGEVPERDRTLLAQWYLPAQENATYKASVWVKTLDITGGTPVMDLTFYGPDRKPIKPWYVIRGEQGSKDWYQIEIEGKAPDGARLMTYRISYGRCAGTMWFDDAALIQVDPPRVQEEPLEWEFAIAGEPLTGVFTVQATAENRKDEVRCDFSGKEGTVPVALQRSRDGRELIDARVPAQ
jgi:hypothetical protein